MPCCSSSTSNSKVKTPQQTSSDNPAKLGSVRPSDKSPQCCASSSSNERCKCGSACACEGCNSTKL
ncbi:LAFA_0E10132g1_1 [Lachancea sp. 'fantastica']|nr:LAFA_0E10132g1_1 [Lachancea sp. 'fantastica']